ncbi:MAG TPA: hypothetical protein VK790_03615 [Solirubrobacteraceae bacterium]|nr:hypothetical protein [Solirubrobacteraceae bacterium]
MAAIERAIRHDSRGRDAESLSTIKEHLGLPHNGWTTIRLRPQLEALEAAGLIEQSRRDTRDLCGLTTKGRHRLDAVRAEITLPEAPQHRHWREARSAAGERIAGFRGDLRGALDEALALIEADHEADSAAWFELGERLYRSGRLLASAIHCLREWPEPHDDQADVDNPPHKQRDRRNTRGWDGRFTF